MAHPAAAGWSLPRSQGRAVIELAKELEPDLGSERELAHLADWGSKYMGAVGRIAGNLHLAEYGAEKGVRKAVEVATIRAAAQIGDYFKACAINAFAEMGADRVTADAVYLLGRIEHLGADEVSEREMFTAKPQQVQDDETPATGDRLANRARLSGCGVGQQTNGWETCLVFADFAEGFGDQTQFLVAAG